MGYMESAVGGEDAKHVDIVLDSPDDIHWIPGTQYPVGTIAHTEDLKVCYVWTGREWEKC